jgi:hypothetical protein
MLMPTYHFHLATLDGKVCDMEGMELPDEATAREHARQVACELMRHREPRTRAWRVEVTDGPRQACFELLFASVDSTIDHLTPQLRASVEKLCFQSASLSDTIRAVKNSLVDAKTTLARVDGRTYLAALPMVERR